MERWHAAVAGYLLSFKSCGDMDVHHGSASYVFL